MTQQKKCANKAPTFNMKPMNLHKKFMALNEHDQQGVTYFFNAHNTAHFIYDGLSEDAKSYISYCINISQNADRIEEKQSAQVS